MPNMNCYERAGRIEVRALTQAATIFLHNLDSALRKTGWNIHLSGFTARRYSRKGKEGEVILEITPSDWSHSSFISCRFSRSGSGSDEFWHAQDGFIYAPHLGDGTVQNFEASGPIRRQDSGGKITQHLPWARY